MSSAGLIGKPVQVRHGPATVKQGLLHMPLSVSAWEGGEVVTACKSGDLPLANE
ncbi:hypothetical protein PVOR_27899 [Paenibacillus vortex V453]|jgi:hypothetical protein|uniref:Uncharacterized protein n=1 Tax=Paenibacillus vortex V453 TaxID=715225 RepID=A0A2R9SND4_9BACL|nr:hypothetical protein PVOR_27899 [Paenibacillus vortex V453]